MLKSDIDKLYVFLLKVIFSLILLNMPFTLYYTTRQHEVSCVLCIPITFNVTDIFIFDIFYFNILDLLFRLCRVKVFTHATKTIYKDPSYQRHLSLICCT